ncbi:MAG: DUF1294 domain-containing protein [Congregibacter sp.]
MKKRNSRTLYRSDALAGVFLLTVGGAVAVGLIPKHILGIYLLLSVATFLVYAWDKSAARRGAWRTSERTLHLLGVIGGWPGAVLAQNHLRHKSSKLSFLRLFWVTAIVNCAAFVWLFTPNGLQFWEKMLSEIARGI